MLKNQTGKPYPLGATLVEVNGTKGVNFSIFSASARAIELCLFDNSGREVRFPILDKTDDIFHIWVPNVPLGTKYGFRIHGDERHNPEKLMLDPYAKMVVGKPDLTSKENQAWYLLSDKRDNGKIAPKSIIIDGEFDWEQDKPLNIPWTETIIYELHVKGFSKLRADLPEEIRGTYSALAHPSVIAYLKELGITAVELLPINFSISESHLQERGISNYWGYNPMAMFAVEPQYAATEDPVHEFKTMVKTLHQAGIEVILDMVFNHSAESERDFPTFSYRGIDEQTYYWSDAQGNYLNWSGCGNLLHLAHPYMRRWAIDCLRYWVEEYHIDGFRFDLATNLGRETPAYKAHSELFKAMRLISGFKNTKFIAEPWDMGEDGYQMGNFPPFFAEWNDRFRDDINRFWLWQSGELGAFAERFAGSADIFKQEGKYPHNSVNFITAHDGFTLRDLVSYNHKHNNANGEDNRDGRNENYSHNHGIEGSTDGLDEPQKTAVENARILSSQSLLCSLLLSNGTPMLLAGDEFGNTQFGNNNGYCQDSGLTWLKWSNFNLDLFEIVKKLIIVRKGIQSLVNDKWWTEGNVRWFNEFGSLMNVSDWQERGAKALQVLLDEQWLCVVNAKTELQVFSLPEGDWNMEISMTGCKNQNNQLIVDNLSFCLLRRIL